jgi:hypothetical protein
MAVQTHLLETQILPFHALNDSSKLAVFGPIAPQFGHAP